MHSKKMTFFSLFRVWPIALFFSIVLLVTMGVHAQVMPNVNMPFDEKGYSVDAECAQYDRCVTSLSTTFGDIKINFLEDDYSKPEQFAVSGTLSFTWNPSLYPDWSPSQLSIACRDKECKFPGWSNILTGKSGDNNVWSANFQTIIDETTSLVLFPFDQHWVHLKLSANDPTSQRFIENLDVASFNIGLTQRVIDGITSNFQINYGTVTASMDGRNIRPTFIKEEKVEQLRQQASLGNKIMGEVFLSKKDSGSFIVSLQVLRDTPAALLMVFIPILLVLFNTNLAFHWRESSPASRFGGSGLLTIVSLFFASRIFRPDVDYLVFTDVWFLVAFFIITTNNVLLAWLFRFYKHRQCLKTEGRRPIQPAYKTENKLTYISVSSIICLGLIFVVLSNIFRRPPGIPEPFLESNASIALVGSSVTKVVQKHDLASSQGGRLLIDLKQ